MRTMHTVAALYVERGGCYYDLPGVDPWDKDRDARLYAGPWPVVAHPPCERWGRYATGGPSNHGRFVVGADGGCFRAALDAVRHWGGVIEHPADSKAWDFFGIQTPAQAGWRIADLPGHGCGWTCCVDQGNYGHSAAKKTWLYYVPNPALLPGQAPGFRPPEMIWGRSGKGIKPTDREVRLGRRSGVIERMSHAQRQRTPPEFRDVLLALARAGQEEAGHG